MHCLVKIVKYHLYQETKQQLPLALMCHSNATAKQLPNAYTFQQTITKRLSLAEKDKR